MPHVPTNDEFNRQVVGVTQTFLTKIRFIPLFCHAPRMTGVLIEAKTHKKIKLVWFIHCLLFNQVREIAEFHIGNLKVNLNKLN